MIIFVYKELFTFSTEFSTPLCKLVNHLKNTPPLRSPFFAGNPRKIKGSISGEDSFFRGGRGAFLFRQDNLFKRASKVLHLQCIKISGYTNMNAERTSAHPQQNRK